MDNKDVMVKFTTLCHNDSAYNKIECQNLFKYILERYANMPGTYFAKHLKVIAKSNIDPVVDSKATRICVVNAIACSKAVSKLDREEPEKQLWKNIGHNVMANHDELL